MKLLLPLGLLGLIGILALILIYVIKPNYLQKVIPSTYMWKRSLQYRKKRVPVSRINNILLFVCQLLVLSLCGLLLAKPVIAYERAKQQEEKIIILDASASMRMSDGVQTRFERAVEEIRTVSTETLQNGGKVSIIFADEKADVVDLTASQKEEQSDVLALLDGYLDNDSCTYGSADIKGAVALAEEMLLENSEAEVLLYTATKYLQTNGVTVMDVSDEKEWNAAVLDVRTVLDQNNHYQVEVDVGCFGKTEQLVLACNVVRPNGNDNVGNVLLEKKVNFVKSEAEQKTVVFTADDFNTSNLGAFLYSYQTLDVRVQTSADSYLGDNEFYLYGGENPTVKVQYASSQPNDFFEVAIRALRQQLKWSWDIEYTEVGKGQTPADEGFDFYIYEHKMPAELPKDGVILLVDPDSAPEGVGFRVEDPKYISSETQLEAGVPHAVTQYVYPEMTTIAKYNVLQNVDPSYQVLTSYDGNPVMMVKEEAQRKIMVWALDLHYSSLPADYSFPLILFNTINHYVPTTFSSHVYEIGDTVEFNARGLNLNVTGVNVALSFDEFPSKLTLKTPGPYMTEQTALDGVTLIIEQFFVTIPDAESNITKTLDSLPEMEVPPTLEKAFDDLLFYFALALTALLFLEWWLHSRERL